MKDTTRDIIRRRKSVFPKSYTGEEVPEEVLLQLLESARWAPTHKMTEPWRFVVFSGDGRRKLGEYLSAQYRLMTPEEKFSEMAFEKMLQNPQRAGAVIGIGIHPDPDHRVPEWEEIAAVSCAVQNMWLTATELGLGAYWSTPGAAVKGSDFPGLQPGERCLGLFYTGYYEMPDVPRDRQPVEAFTRWIV